jgi:hypothetical protein
MGGCMSGASALVLACGYRDDGTTQAQRDHILAAERRRTNARVTEAWQKQAEVERQWNSIADEYEKAILLAWAGLKAPASWRKKSLAEFEALAVVHRAVIRHMPDAAFHQGDGDVA